MEVSFVALNQIVTPHTTETKTFDRHAVTVVYVRKRQTQRPWHNRVSGDILF